MSYDDEVKLNAAFPCLIIEVELQRAVQYLDGCEISGWVPAVTAVHDDINASVYEGLKVREF